MRSSRRRPGIAGPALLIALALAAFVALCNALSSAQLAAVLPRTGGTYEFGRRMLGPWWGYSAGWMFLVANTVGPGAIALAFGEYLSAVWPGVPTRAIAVAAALSMTMLNALGIRRSVRVTEVVVVFSVLTLLSVFVLALPSVRPSNFVPLAPAGVLGILQATALLFFAYTGYSRVATLVEEVKDPRRTIPRATGVALGSATVLYLLVAVGGGRRPRGDPAVAVRLTAGGDDGRGRERGRGRARRSPGPFRRPSMKGSPTCSGSPAWRSPWVAARTFRARSPTWAPARTRGSRSSSVGIVATLVSAFAPFTLAIAVSSFGTLLYYVVTNLSALRLRPEQRMFPRVLIVAGLVGCVGLALSLAPLEVGVGLVLLAGGIAFRIVWLRVRPPVPAETLA